MEAENYQHFVKINRFLSVPYNPNTTVKDDLTIFLG